MWGPTAAVTWCYAQSYTDCDVRSTVTLPTSVPKQWSHRYPLGCPEEIHTPELDIRVVHKWKSIDLASARDFLNNRFSETHAICKVLRSSRQDLDYWTYLLIKDSCFKHFSAWEAPVYFTNGGQVSCSIFKFANSQPAFLSYSSPVLEQPDPQELRTTAQGQSYSYLFLAWSHVATLSTSVESWNKWVPSFHWMGEIQAHILHVNNPLFPFLFEGVQQCIPPPSKKQ